MSDAGDVLYSKTKLIVDEWRLLVTAATSAEVTARAARRQLRSGNTIRQVFKIAFDPMVVAAGALIEAHLDLSTRATDKQVTLEVVSRLRPALIVHLANEGLKGYVCDQDTWQKGIGSLMVGAEEFFLSIEDRVRARRFDRARTDKDTRLDRIVRRAKNHPAAAWVIAVGIGLSAIFGVVKAGQEVVSWFRPSPTTTTSAADLPAIAPERAPLTPAPTARPTQVPAKATP